MAIPSRVINLIEHFGRDIKAFRSGQYNETQVRREFIDPFFKALGWDVENEQGVPETYKDIIHEDQIKVGGQTKAPDYCFRVGGSRKFFLEAKKPAVNLETDNKPAFQLRRYAWSANLPVSILTDFEEFVVYDCRIKPNKDDKPTTARTLYLDYTEYYDRWHEIEALFHRDAVLAGSLDQYTETLKDRKGVATVDDAFLTEIESWRRMLAENIAERNPHLSKRDINYAVQMTIDRIIFLRICEDRGIEPYERLKTVLTGGAIYPRLCNIFQDADDRYNSGLFHFRKEKDRPESPDDLTLSLVIDDEPFQRIITNFYYPDSPYEFSVLPIEILGQVYEQFLGKVINLTSDHRAKVDDKPEVRKAGGVYYTPTYIVDYIVKNTVGKLLEGKTPRQVAKLKILDPACGSGSFLIGAYQFLLDWHRDWYVNDGSEKHKKDLYQALSGEWRLTSDTRKRILLNNIFGVDIDPQAVEVTKLSLLLKVLEGESSQSLSTQLRMFHERALPDLGSNIKCGNSLIGPDFYENAQSSFLTEEDEYSINVFDWKREFSDILDSGGFDAVIGNPPYVRIQTTDRKVISYYGEHYETAVGNYDIYCLLVEKGVKLLRSGGRMGYIVAHRFFKTDYGEGLRKFIADNKNLEQIIDFDGYMVFKASINTCILLLARNKEDKFCFGQVRFHKKRQDEVASMLANLSQCDQLDDNIALGPISTSTLTPNPWVFIWPREASLWAKLNDYKTRLGNVTTHIFQGLKTGADPIYIGEMVTGNGETLTFKCQFDNNVYEIENEIVKPLIKGGHMNRYLLEETTKRIIFPYEKGKLIPQTRMLNDFPKTWSYLLTHKTYLENREDGKLKGDQWYAYTRSQALNSMHLPRIDTPDYYAHASYCLDAEAKYYFCGGGAGGYGIVLKPGYNPYYILALLNSKLLDWYLRKVSVRAYQTAFMYVKKYIEQLPVKLVDPRNASEQKKESAIVAHVERMMDTQKRLLAARTNQDRSMLKRQIEGIDDQINRLVYELYGLDDKEIKVVVEAMK